MKKLILGLSLAATFLASSAFAENGQGKSIFEEKGCALCHKPDLDTVGPSLKTIATGYTGKMSALITYLQGQGSAIIEPDRATVMNPQLVKIRTLPEDNIRAVAEHIMVSSERPH